MDSQQQTVMESPMRVVNGFLSLGNAPNSRGGSFSSTNGGEESMDVDDRSNQSHAQRCSARDTTLFHQSFLRDGSGISKIVATVGIKGTNVKATVTQELKHNEGEQPKSQTAYLMTKPSNDAPDGPVWYEASQDPPDPNSGEILGCVTIGGVKINGVGAEQTGYGIGQSQEQSPQPQLPLSGHGVNGMRFGGCDEERQMPSRQQAWQPPVIQNEQMQIFVLDLRGKTHTLRVKRTDMVDDLMRYVEEKTGVAQCQQRLHYAGKDLAKGMRLQHYGIENESTVHLTARLRGGSLWLIKLGVDLID